MRIESSLSWADRQRRSIVWVLMLVALCWPASAVAQVTGTISGYVQDQGGGVVPGATVTAESSGQQLVRSAPTNAAGFFDFQALPRGRYSVKVELSGFETVVQKEVEVTAGGNVRLDFSMRVRGLAEQVDVAARATM